MAVKDVPHRRAESEANEPSKGKSGPGARVRFWRSVFFPLAAIAIIAAAIWWLEYRPGEEAGRSVTGAKFGPVDLPATLVPAAMDVGPQEGKLAPDFVLETLDGGGSA